MTLQEILECSAEQLEAMDDATLEKHFAQYLNVTRPEIAAMQRTTPQVYVSPERAKGMAAMAEILGADNFNVLFKGKKKR